MRCGKPPVVALLLCDTRTSLVLGVIYVENARPTRICVCGGKRFQVRMKEAFGVGKDVNIPFAIGGIGDNFLDALDSALRFSGYVHPNIGDVVPVLKSAFLMKKLLPWRAAWI